MKSVNNVFRIPEINDDGWKFMSIMAVLTVVFALVWLPLGFIFLAADALCFTSFRNPERVTPVLSGAVVSPADGTVTAISKEKGPDCIGMQNKKFNKIRIYSDIFDVHILRMPLKATVGNTFYYSGKPLSGSLDPDNIGNEKFVFAFRHSEGFDLAMQIKSVFCSKRIVCAPKKGDEFAAGNRIGSLRFGGYVDVYLPEKACPQVCTGQRVIAGETILADVKSDAPRIEGEIR